MTQAYEIIEDSYDVVIIGAGGARLDYRPVHMQPLSNDLATIPLKERVY